MAMMTEEPQVTKIMIEAKKRNCFDSVVKALALIKVSHKFFLQNLTEDQII